MARYKTPDFEERAAMARRAKQDALQALRDKPAPDPAAIAEQQAALAARNAAAAERRAARLAAAAEAKAAKLAARQAEEEARKATPPPPVVVPPTEAELKAARDAKYAARKARKR